MPRRISVAVSPIQINNYPIKGKKIRIIPDAGTFTL